jgi:hypothetical protein
VAEPVVDRLEPVEVEVEQVARACVAAGAGLGLADPLGQERPVRQPGQRVVQGAVVQLGLEVLAVRHVLDVHDEVRRPVDGRGDARGAHHHPDDAAVGAQEAALVPHDAVDAVLHQKSKVIGALRRLQKMPHIVRAFFADPDLRYITE